MTNLDLEHRRATTWAELIRLFFICAAVMLALGFLMPGEW